MKKQLVYERPKIIFLLIILVISACGTFDDQGRRRYPTAGAYEESGDYLINPDTILVSLDQGKTNVFMPMLATPGADDDLMSPGSFGWTQSDYLKIANALSQYVWKETMEDWSIYYINFDTNCHNGFDGFDSFNITYYKTIRVNSGTEYTAREIEIYPLFKQVTWGGETNFPRPFLGGWNDVDLKNFKITADKALQIADVNGGKDARSRVKNDCRLSVNSTNNKWNVIYYTLAPFEVIIDPYTGKFKAFNEFQ